MQFRLRHCKAGSSSEYSKVIIEPVDRFRIRRTVFVRCRSNLLACFDIMTSCHGPVIIRTVLLFYLSMFSEAVSLARLVEAEIVSPYHGILINTGVGNPTTPSIVALGE